MIDFYTGNTPNGQRAAVVLEECGLPYTLHKLDVFSGITRQPEFLKINPNGRIPVVLDHDGPHHRPFTLAQSWAIAIYLAEKTGRFLPQDQAKRLKVLEWLLHVGTDVTMVHSTLNAVSNFVPEKTPSTISFYSGRLGEIWSNLDRRLAESEYLAGELSIADFCLYPIFVYRRLDIEKQGNLMNLLRWGASLDGRPGCQRGIQVTK